MVTTRMSGFEVWSLCQEEAEQMTTRPRRRRGVSLDGREGTDVGKTWASSSREKTAKGPPPRVSREGGPSCAEPTTGLEPVTPVLQVRCATNCAKSAGAVLQCRRRPASVPASRGQVAGAVVAGAVVAGAGEPVGEGDGERVGVGVP